MKLHNFKLWFGFLIAIVVLAFMLFQQSNRNKLELENQAVRNMQLVKSRLKGTFVSLVGEKLAQKKREHAGKQKNINVEDISFILLDNNSPEDKDHHFSVRFSNGDPSILSMSSLFAPIVQQDFFEHLVLTDTSGYVRFPTLMAGQRLVLENLSPKQHSVLPIIKNTISTNNQPYFVYTTPVDIGGTKFYLHGLISQEFFERIGRKVDFTNITVLVFVLSLMFFSLPLFSFFGLGLGDTVTRFGVYLVGLSLIGIMLVVGFGTAFFKDHHPVGEEDHYRHMVVVRDLISRRLGINAKLLETWDSAEVVKHNARLKINSLGITTEFYSNGKKLGSPENWILTHRDYFRYHLYFDSLFKKNDEKKKPFYVGAHYSLVNSKRVIVVSSDLPTENEIEVIGFEAKDWFKNIDVPAEFLVFKEDGLVLGSSEDLKVIADSVSQLLPKSQWEEIKSLVNTNRQEQNDNQWHLSTYLDGHAMHATLVRLNSGIEFDQPIWLLYFVDEHLEHVFSSLVTYESTFFVILYILILATLSLINKFVRPRSDRLAIYKFAYGYLYPKPSKRKAFSFLICFLVVNCAWILYFFHLPSVHIVGVFLIMVISTFQIKILMYIWLDPEYNSGTGDNNNLFSDTLWRFLAVMGSGIMILSIYLFYHLNHPTVRLFFVWILLSIVASLDLRRILSIKTRSGMDSLASSQKQTSKILDRYPLKPYPIFLVFWMFSIGFLPGYIIFSKVFQFEKQKWHIDLVPDGDHLGSEPGDTSNGDIINLPKEFWHSYDEWRRQIFGGFTSESAPEVYSFIAANRVDFPPKSVNEYWNGDFFKDKLRHFQKEKTVSLWYAAIFIGTIVVFYILVKVLSQRIYLIDETGSKPPRRNEGTWCSPISDLIFLCGVDTMRNLDWIAYNFTYTGKYLFETNCLSNPALLVDTAAIKKTHRQMKIWLVSNVHSLSDQNVVLERLPSIVEYCKKTHLKLIVTSGNSWKHLLGSFENDTKQVAYSELFSEFQLEYIPIMGLSFEYLERIHQTEQESVEYVRSRKPYFFNIWEEMSLEEKKVCYDFSMNDFYNHTNKAVIAELQQKGILIRRNGDELPKLFSVFFRQFIRNNVSEAEKINFRNFEKRNGNAGNIQIAVFSFLLLAVALISYFDKNFLDQATTFVTGIVGALGGLYSLLSKGLFNFGANKKASE